MQTATNTSINFVDEWKPLNMIGSGSTCDVVLVQDNKSQSKKVIKLFNAKVKPAVAEAEAKLLLSLNHPRILSASGYFPNVVLPQSSTEKAVPAIVMEYVPNGDLLELIQTFGNLPEVIARSYFLQLIDALGYLHGKGYCHLDIKPDNILVDEHFNLKLADLGVTAQIPKECLVKGYVGTASYHTPEIHAKLPYNAYQADLFALGVTLFTMVSGNMPFVAAKKTDAVYNLIIEGKFNNFWSIHDSLAATKNIKLSKSFKNLMESMLSADSSKRLSLEQIKKHVWVEGAIPSDKKLFAMMNAVLNKPQCAGDISETQTMCLEENLISATC